VKHTKEQLQEYLDIKFDFDINEDLDEPISIRTYFSALLQQLWHDPQGFGGKRPFGNSDWYFEIYQALALHGAIEATFDDGYMGEFDEDAAHELVSLMIDEAL
jgi:hypothetical protein